MFAAMFPDRDIDRLFNMGRTKNILYVINHGPAPPFKSMLFEDLKKLMLLCIPLMKA